MIHLLFLLEERDMKVLVSGSRDWTDRNSFFAVLEDFNQKYPHTEKLSFQEVVAVLITLPNNLPKNINGKLKDFFLTGRNMVQQLDLYVTTICYNKNQTLSFVFL